MTADTRTPDQIERDIERDRGELARTLAELESRFTPEAVIGEVARNLRRHGGDMGHAVSQAMLGVWRGRLAWFWRGAKCTVPRAASKSTPSVAVPLSDMYCTEQPRRRSPVRMSASSTCCSVACRARRGRTGRAVCSSAWKPTTPCRSATGSSSTRTG